MTNSSLSRCIGLLAFLFAPFLWAADLHIEPAVPVAAAGTQLNLSVSGSSGTLLWNAAKGKIQGNGTQVIYLPPAETGLDSVSVMDALGSIGAVAVTVIPAEEEGKPFAEENSVWELFLRRDRIKALAFSADGKTLWVGTGGGLEQRDAHSGELLKVFSDVDGLPGNNVLAVLPEPEGGLWVGTWNGGLGHRDPSGHWTQLNSDNSPLNNDRVTSLCADGEGGIWIGTFAEESAAFDWDKEAGNILHRDAEEQWTIFDQSNSPLEQNSSVLSVRLDPNGELWAATENTGILHLDANGQWQVHDRYNGLPSTWDFFDMAFDDQGKVWVGSMEGLAAQNPDGTWDIFTTADSGLPDNGVRRLISDGEGGLWLGTREGGLARRDVNGEWTVWNPDNSRLQNAYIRVLLRDGKGGVWVGTYGGLHHYRADASWRTFEIQNQGVHGQIRALLRDENNTLWAGHWLQGLARRDADGVWEEFTMENSSLPDNHAGNIVSDGAGGVWLAPVPETEYTDGPGGLSHLSAAGEWRIFTRADGLPGDHFNALESDGQGGVWAGRSGFGLARVTAAGEVSVYTQSDSGLPSNFIHALLSDNNGGLWVGTYYGLARLTGSAGSERWEEFTAADSGFPGAGVQTLASDGRGGIWIGTGGDGVKKLVHYDKDGNWHVFDTDNSDLPDNDIRALLADAGGGVWIGMAGGGLAYFAESGAWQVFNTLNSRLPDRQVNALALDAGGGIWAGTENGGLARLSFSEKLRLANVVNDTERTELLVSGQAAIIIHPNGQSSGYNQARAIDFMASYAYHSLYARGYDNDEIYFLSYRPDLDINGDALSDVNVVDAPVSLEQFNAGSVPRNIRTADVEAAFQWAAEQGRSDLPLVVVFVDHGIPGGLLLDPLGKEILDVDTLRGLLDAYQTATDNQVIVILEACHTGSLISGLAAANRVIISSTDENLAYYDDLGRVSFLKLYFDQLRAGENLAQALQSVAASLLNYRRPLNRQKPQLDDSAAGILAAKLCLNGCWAGLPGVLTLTAETSQEVVAPGQSVVLKARTAVLNSSVRNVWASVTTPRSAAQRNEHGYSRLPAPIVYLRSSGDDLWEGDFNEFNEQGDYVFAIKARDHQGFVSEAEPFVLHVEQGEILARARFDITAGILDLPVVTVPSGDSGLSLYRAQLELIDDSPVILRALPETLLPVSENDAGEFANYNSVTAALHIPLLEIPNSTGGMDAYSLTLKLISGDLRFEADLTSLRPYDF
ncbi:MAG: hypothetical protein GY862_19440 [Gammaproteobacteria bacterium]|nr:hypothetical protein [Gammaproteobacteria bacterium]